MPVDNFKTFRAMHMAEYYSAGLPWLYLLLHQQVWLKLFRPYRDPYEEPIPEQVSLTEHTSPNRNNTIVRPDGHTTDQNESNMMSYMNNVKNNNASQNSMQYPPAHMMHDGTVDVEAFREMLKRKTTRKDVNNFRHIQLDEITPLR